MEKQDDIVLNKLKNIKLQQAEYKGVSISENTIEIEIILKSPAMHVKKTNEFLIKEGLKDLDKKVVIVISDSKDTSPITPKENKLPNIKNIIAIASGKGGVGKSTVTSSLAVELTNKEFKVGIVDADIYGPSIPKIFGVENEKPLPDKENKKILPVEKNNVKIMSIGFFAEVNQAVVWRGPMASKALSQMLFDTQWGELDYLLIDLPPGTGDIHLSIVQFLPLTGAIIISTPQDISIIDARKGLEMFKQDSINVPVLGMIENMAYFTPKELPNNKYYIFGKDGVKNLSKELKINFLGEIPIVIDIRENCDNGDIMKNNKNETLKHNLSKITTNLMSSIKLRNDNLPPTEKVEITNMDGCS